MLFFIPIHFFSAARASCMRKQSLAIFHLSAWAVIMNVCWNGFEPPVWNFTVPDTCIRYVSWPDTESSTIGCASSVWMLCSELGRSWKYFWIFSLPMASLPFHTSRPVSRYRRDICWNNGHLSCAISCSNE